jgi:hydroxymethylpyrimidine/phosphomethylpyrimidine kinase
LSQDPALLTVHAADTLAEEGVLADAAVCAELNVRPVALVTSILVAGSSGPQALEPLSLGLLAEQFASCVAQAKPTVARIGILRDSRQVELLAGLLEDSTVRDVVLAPVARVGGTPILDDETLQSLRASLFPRARVLVVRVGDVAALTGSRVEDLDDVKRACAELRGQGAGTVLVVGVSSRGRVLDVLDEDGRLALFDASRIAAPRIPGLSGAHAAALACHLARRRSLKEAVDAAQRYVALRLQRGR